MGAFRDLILGSTETHLDLDSTTSYLYKQGDKNV